MAYPTDRNRFEVEVKTHADGSPYIQVSENHQNPDDGVAGAGKVIRFPAFTLRIEDAQELLLDLGEVLVQSQGFVEFTRLDG